MWWDPARDEHYETPPSIADTSGYEVRDFHLPAGFRISPVGYRSRSRLAAARSASVTSRTRSARSSASTRSAATRSDAADHMEDGAEALAKLGIRLP
jgi:hypothetical protein